MEKELLEKILAVLEAQDAKIEALEKSLEAMGDPIDTLIDTLYHDKDSEMFNAFSERHRSKFEPYLGVMDKLEGRDSFRALYDRANELDQEEGYNEDSYISDVLASVIETIDGLKAVAPPEAQEALDEAQEAVAEAAIEAQEPEEAEIKDPALDDWSEEALEKEKLEGRQMFR